MEILLTIDLIITLIAIIFAILIIKKEGKLTIGGLLETLFVTLLPIVNIIFVSSLLKEFKILDFKLWERKKPK